MEISKIKIGTSIYDIRDDFARTVTSNNNTATWGNSVVVGTVGDTELKFTMPQEPQGTGGESSDNDVYTITIESNQSNKSDLNSSSVTVSDGYTSKTFTYGDQDNTFTARKNATVSVTDSSIVDGYRKTVNVNTASKIVSVLYETEIVTVTVSTDTAGVSAEGTIVSFRYRGQKTVGSSGIVTEKIPFGDEYYVSFSGGIQGYITPKSSDDFVASQPSRSISAVYVKDRTGVFAMDANGNEIDIEQADGSCIGVVVRDPDNNVAFLIPKISGEDVSKVWDNQYTLEEDGENTYYWFDAIPGCAIGSPSVARADFLGYENTQAILQVRDSAQIAAVYCNNQTITINGNTLHGYLGSGGEWAIAFYHKSEIDTALANMGSAPLKNYYYYTSTQRSADRANIIYWTTAGSAVFDYADKQWSVPVRPFYSLK